MPTMPTPTPTFFLVALPNSVARTGDGDDALAALRSAVPPDHGTTSRFPIPELKIGTLDALVQQADDLAKLEAGCRAVVAKVADALRTLLDGDAEKLQEQKAVNDKPVDAYLQSFQWNRGKYRAEKPIGELLDVLQKDVAAVDADVKAKLQQHAAAKTALAARARAHAGNLSQRSLDAVVDPATLLRPDASEYLEQHLVAVPAPAVKEFYKIYESLAPMVVPRSARLLAQDDEFHLFAVTTFRKHASDFVHKARENRWVPREATFAHAGRDGDERELRRLEQEERRLWGEALRLARTGYSDAVMGWIHVLTLRVFVETVLRYGLPLAYVCGLVKTDAKRSKKAKQGLDARFSHLGGHAIGTDKNGRPKPDDSSMQQDMAATGLGGGGADQGFEPYVFYQFEIV